MNVSTQIKNATADIEISMLMRKVMKPETKGKKNNVTYP